MSPLSCTAVILHVDSQIFSYLLHPLYSHVRISESLPCCEQAVGKEGNNNSGPSSRHFIPQITLYYSCDMLDMMEGKQNTNLDALGFSFKAHGIVVVEFLLSIPLWAHVRGIRALSSRESTTLPWSSQNFFLKLIVPSLQKPEGFFSFFPLWQELCLHRILFFPIE